MVPESPSTPFSHPSAAEGTTFHLYRHTQHLKPNNAGTQRLWLPTWRFGVHFPECTDTGGGSVAELGHGQVLSGLEPITSSTFMLGIYKPGTYTLRKGRPTLPSSSSTKKALKKGGRQCVAKGLGLEVRPEFKRPVLAIDWPVVEAWVSHLSLVPSITQGQQQCLLPRTAVRDATRGLWLRADTPTWNTHTVIIWECSQRLKLSSLWRPFPSLRLPTWITKR